MTVTVYNVSETTVSGPALTYFDNHPTLAWAAGGGFGGGPPDLRLNIRTAGLDPDPRTWGKVVVEERSQHSPALTGYRNRLHLGWTGLNGHLNLRSGTGAADLAAHNDIQILADTANGGPALAAHKGFLVLAWTGIDAGPTGHVNLIWSPDGRSWPAQNRLTFAHNSHTTPALLNTHDSAGNEYLYLAWTDPSHRIFVMFTANARFDRFNLDLVGLATNGRAEGSLTGPGLAPFNTGNFVAPDQVVITWAGDNPGRNVNIMRSGTGNTHFNSKRTWNETASSNVSATRIASQLYYAYRGTDGVGGLYLGKRDLRGLEE